MAASACASQLLFMEAPCCRSVGRSKGSPVQKQLACTRPRWAHGSRLHALQGKGSQGSGRQRQAVSSRAEIVADKAEEAQSQGSVGKLQKAWLYSQYGAARDVLTLGEVDVPEVGPDEILVRVEAGALNPIDSKRRLGKFASVDSPLPTVPGYDVAGVVAQVGSQVKAFKKGDEVYSHINENPLKPKQLGSLAQYTVVKEALVALKPKNLSFLDAAGLPLAIQTAQQALEQAKLSKGQSVLVVGGAGGVGSLAIQLAKEVYGAGLVATTTSTTKIDLVKSLGADVVIDYTKESYEDAPEKYDVVFDTVGESVKGVKALKEGGAIVALTGALVPPATRFVVISNGPQLAQLTPFLESGKVKPLQDPRSPFPFSQLVEAFEHLETGRAVGKIVIGPVE